MLKTSFNGYLMLVDFRFENFRSYKALQILSFTAFERMREGLDSHSVASNRKDIPRLLKVATLYGPNASGKTNVIKALQFMQTKILNQEFSRSSDLSQPTFRLDKESPESPTRFEISLLLDGICYRYGFSLLKGKVIEEYLHAYVKAIPQTWFERSWEKENQKYRYKYSPFFKGIKSACEKATDDNALYLAVATRLNSEQLKPIYDWFKEKLVIINDLAPLTIDYTVRSILQNHRSNQVDDFLWAADLGVSKTRILPKLQSAGLNSIVECAYDVYFTHNLKWHSVAFPLSEESRGTQKLYALAGPLIDTIEKNAFLAIDDLDTNLHPMLLEAIVKLFYKKKDSQAQLLFATHCDTLLENSTIPKSKVEPVLRRDQIWITEKRRDFQSSLVSLLEYKPRKQESIRDGYRRGRYGGLPMLSSFGEQHIR